MNYTIRKVTINDLDAVTHIEQVCFPEAEAAGREAFENRIKTFPDSFFVAEAADGSLIGFINGCVTNDRVISDEMFEDSSLHIENGDYQSIFGLDVIPEWRNKGVAASMMRHLIENAREHGRRGLILTCKDSLIKYYAGFGYRNTGLSNSIHGGAVWYDMILEF